ncbi:Thiosulfate sulfurtransferase GlpE [Shimia sp. SK013]|uniref:rhodanese-like domain-containing protein n=1 Tax=Shimia sp. SK013 TaxID=1389006 RepID=UPI0006B41DBE|nr:rhodanese-like domain-containing protein [Shimia sp. SK013]KPA21168.1 Thiosulfate sulfurtransferase GlpE [Shimia sp. SK013]
MTITPVKTLVAQAKDQITSLSQDAAEEMVADGKALFVDIRDPRELAREGRIEGAFHAPRGMLEFWFDPESPYHKPALATDKTLILFCASAWRSALSVKTLQDMGATNVAEMEGGFATWKKRGAPVDTD